MEPDFIFGEDPEPPANVVSIHANNSPLTRDRLKPSHIDAPSQDRHNIGMNPVTREEIDAKLATIEAKMEGRLARIDDKLAGIETKLSEQKNTAWKAAGATIGVFVGVFAVYVAAFDSGRETARMAAEAQARTQEALQEIRRVADDLKASAVKQKSTPEAEPRTSRP